MRSTSKKFAAVAIALSLGVAACGSDTDNATPNTTGGDGNTTDNSVDNGDTADVTGVNSPASALRAGLTSLLQEHLYLAGIALEQAVVAGGDLEDPVVVASLDALDENSVALADAVGGIAGDENGEAFLGLWREHIGFFADYTIGKATADDAKVAQALSDLEGYEQAAGAFFEDITGGKIVAADLVEGLKGHVSTTTTAIDALVAGDASVFTKLRAAGQHMPGAALFLSNGIAEALPEMFPGGVESTPAATRAVLTNLLQEHVYLAGIALEQGVKAGGDLTDPVVQAALDALDENSVALADVVGSVAGEDNREAFLGLWREHIGFFADYTIGKATADDAMVQQAKDDLAGYKQASAAFFEDITGGALPQDAVIAALDPHTVTLFAAIDALVAGDASVFTKLRAAAQEMPGIANALAGGIVAATS